MKKVGTILKQPWVFPAVLLGICLAAYGLQLAHLGFYWDDWEDVFLHHLGGQSFFWNYFAYDRPFTAWVYVVFFPLLKMDPVKWQVFNILLRSAGLVGFWWVFKQIWPRREAEIAWFTALLAVYPGFTQQNVSVTYSRHFVSYALFSLSLVLMVLSVQKPRWRIVFAALGVAAAFLQMMTIEYLFGLELLRPVLLWILDREDNCSWRRKAWRTFLSWLPYLVALGIFLYWRFVIFASSSPDPEANAPVLMANLMKNPLSELVRLINLVAQDFIYMVLFVWTDTIDPKIIDLTSKSTLFSWAMGAAAAAGLVWLFLKARNSEEEGGDHFGRQAILLGLLGILLGGIPVWSTNRQVTVGLWSDRFSIAPMFGACLLAVALIDVLGYKRLQKFVLAGLVLALALASQIRTVNKYRLNWDIQRDYYWQLYWRAPQLQPGTAVMGTKMPFGLIADYSVSYALNSIYAPDLHSTRVPFWFFSAMRSRGNEVPDFKDDLPVKYSMRNVTFEGSTTDSIVVHYKAGQACVRVLTQADKDSPLLTSDERKLTAISHLERILPDANQAVSPAEIFGPEPEHGWCYYYEKADLARQTGDWQQVAAMGEEARAKGLTPATGMEWTPYLEGYANTGNWSEAAAISDQALALTDNMQAYLCSAWDRVDKTAPASEDKERTLNEQRGKLGCPAPAQ